MLFTSLHRLLGHDPGPITDALIEEAVGAELAETDDLDFKDRLPPAKGLSETDFPKDVAAMANRGGGTLVYGVEESKKRATARVDVGDLGEVHERALRAVAISAISPPVFGLGIYPTGVEGNRAVTVVVPASVGTPHLIYRNDYFGAPIRNDADTVWMRESQVESLYRARFEARRTAATELDALYNDALVGRDVIRRPWVIAVARPRLPLPARKLTSDDARTLFKSAEANTMLWAGRGALHPLQYVDRNNPRPGLRRRVAMYSHPQDELRRFESWAAFHNDGSVAIASALGGGYSKAGRDPDNVVSCVAVEGAVADLVGMVKAVSERSGGNEFEVRVGLEFEGLGPLVISALDQWGYSDLDDSINLAHFVPVEVAIRADANADDLHWQVHDLAEDCVNQGGVYRVSSITPPSRE